MHRGMLNLGILAHVDAGKTTLTERLLYSAGVIDELGSVDEGTTQTDSLALERQRGITIKSAVASFEVDGVAVNLIDTPGHPGLSKLLSTTPAHSGRSKWQQGEQETAIHDPAKEARAGPADPAG